MSALVDFLNARLDEDERIAKVAAGTRFPAPSWEYEPDGEVHVTNHPDWLITRDYEGLTSAVQEEHGPHIARHDPVRALREVAAKRAILNRRATHDSLFGDDEWAVGRSDESYDTLRIVAAVYSDHPDYAKAVAE